MLPAYRAGLAALLLFVAAVTAAISAPLDEVLHHQARISGSGPRTVIFEAGLGDTLDIWQDIEPKIAAHCSRTFSYNRAGYLGSDVAQSDRDAATVVAELREELQRRHVDPPYVLVGHSLGGLYMQYFARNYPAETAGLLLIDSTNWQQGMVVDTTANTPYQSRKAVTLFMPLIMRRELADSAKAGEEVHASPQPASFPTIILSSTRLAPGETQEQRAQAIDLQNSIAADFPVMQHVFVESSGHYIQRDQPDVVVDAARNLAGCEHRAAAK